MKNIVDGFCGWTLKYKLVDETPQVELRKKFSQSDLLIIVGAGYTYKHYRPEAKRSSTNDYDIHLSCNGPLQLSYNDWSEIDIVVNRTKIYLLDVKD